MKIRNQIIVIIAIFFSVVLITQVTLLQRVKINTQNLVELQSQAQNKLLEAADLNSFYRDNINSWKSILLIGHTTSNYQFYLERFYKSERLIRSTIRDLLKNPTSDDITKPLLIELNSRIQSNSKNYRNALTSYYEKTEEPAKIAEKFVIDESEIIHLIDTIKLQVAEQRNTLLTQSNNDNYHELQLSVLITICVFLLISFVCWLYVHFKIISPIESASKIVNEIKHGNNLLRMPVQGKNEIANFFISFNEMFDELETQNTQLEKAIYQLAESEKLAALGSLVAGVSHELSTPIGVVLMASTSVSTLATDLEQLLDDQKLDKKTLSNKLDQIIQGGNLIESNINRASELISSFKAISVDQASERKRKFEFHQLLTELLTAMEPQFKKSSHKIIISEDIIHMDSYPGPILQVITNFINNSILHGFTENKAGEINITYAVYKEKYIKIVYRDNGKGMTTEVQSHVYEPFYTTSNNGVGSGLGLNIVYNIVYKILKGEIKLESAPGEYTQFTVILPLEIS